MADEHPRFLPRLMLLPALLLLDVQLFLRIRDHVFRCYVLLVGAPRVLRRLRRRFGLGLPGGEHVQALGGGLSFGPVPLYALPALVFGRSPGFSAPVGSAFG
jgi:hypothetical protein